MCPVRGRVLICQLYRQGRWNERSLALEMNKRGWRLVRRRRFEEGQEPVRRRIRSGLVHLAITNPIVVGTYRRDGDGRIRSRDASADLVGWIRPVFALADWNEIQSSIKPRHRSPSTTQVHLLEDLAFCATCEHKMTMSAAKGQSDRPLYRLNHCHDCGCMEANRHQWTMGEVPLMEALIEEARWISVGPDRLEWVRRFLEVDVPPEQHRTKAQVMGEINRLNDMRRDGGFDHDGGREAYRAQIAQRNAELTRMDQVQAHAPTEAAVHKLATLADVLYRGHQASRNSFLPIAERRELREDLKELLLELFEAILIERDPKTRDPRIKELRLKAPYEDLWNICSIRRVGAQSSSDKRAPITVIRSTPRVRDWLREQAA